MNENKLSAFRKLFEANVSLLISFAQRFTSEDTAKDIVQNVFMELWQHFDAANERDYRSYLFVAVRNRCINFLKQEQMKANCFRNIQIENQLLGLDYLDSVDKIIIENENMQSIYSQIEQLPKKCRQIFKLAYFEDKKNAEIAELLQLSIRTVEHHLYLALKTLREKLTKNHK
jgi:RNA polymerase sigma-70 factor (ECF subfamily)